MEFSGGDSKPVLRGWKNASTRRLLLSCPLPLWLSAHSTRLPGPWHAGSVRLLGLASHVPAGPPSSPSCSLRTPALGGSISVCSRAWLSPQPRSGFCVTDSLICIPVSGISPALLSAVSPDCVNPGFLTPPPPCPSVTKARSSNPSSFS